MLQNLLFGAVVLFFFVLPLSLRYSRKGIRWSRIPVFIQNGLSGMWVYATAVAVLLPLGIVVTNVTHTLWIAYALMFFGFPSAQNFVSLGQCLLNGFDVYHAECDVFPGAYTTIFIINSACYFLVGMIVGKLLTVLHKR